jgi:tRNA-specific 2-thiouridylase
MSRIVVAMSGGVDSSVAALLLRDGGHEVVGVSMQLYDQRGGEVTFGSCCTIDDLHDARRVASALGIPHYIVNLERRFEETVVANFVGEYLAGRTPLPCAHCNTDLKFAELVDRADALGASSVATGHYARVEWVLDDPDTRDAPRTETEPIVLAAPGRWRLMRGRDPRKDQSYFLFGLTQAQLARAIFPLAEMTKEEVRALARERGLAVADKDDSQEICFVPGNDYAAVVERMAPGAVLPGEIVDRAGRVLGRHEGVHHFTIGQRKGLRLSSRTPLYVLAVDAAAARVTVGSREALARSTLTASGVNWVAGASPSGEIAATAQIRYRHPPASARVAPLGDRRARVEFDQPQPAITPGQAVVFYDGDEVLGGGWID